MTHPVKPNTWIDIHADGNTRLTYALQTNPAPLTVSVPHQSPQLASLQFVVTNTTNGPIAVESITFTLDVGTTGASITPTTGGVETQVSDAVNWTVTGPGVVTSGPAPYILGPAAGSTVTLAAGASVVVEIYQMQTVQTPGTSTIAVKEMVPGDSPTFASFSVTTFPDGFYFNGLIATVPQGSGLVPVAEIDNNGTNNITLVWNSSVTETTAFSILYSNASSGQQTATPTEVGEWTSPPLTSDTVFTVSVTVAMTGGQPLTAALSTAVSVQNPALIAASITAGTATVDQQLTAASAVIGGSSGLTVNTDGSIKMGTFNAGSGGIESSNTWQTAFVIQNDSSGKAFQFLVGGNSNNTGAAGVGGFGIYDSAYEGFRFNINANGNVGVGTTNPTSKLHVFGNYQNTGAGGFTLDASDGETYCLKINPFLVQSNSVGYQFQTTNGDRAAVPFTICDSGNVGIGTTNPTSKLHIHSDYLGTGATGITLDASDAGATYLLQINPFVVTSGSVGYQFNTYCPTSGTQIPLTIVDSGNVGIGTANPQAPLHVWTEISTTHSLQDQYTYLGYQWNSSGPNQYLLNLSERLGSQNTFSNTSICSEGRIIATEYDAFSDERAKVIQGRSESSSDLQKMLGLEVTDYRYKDVAAKGYGPHKKLIAQQVENVFPQAVSLTTGPIPDIYCDAVLTDGWVKLATDMKKGERVRLIVDNTDSVYEVTEAQPDRFRVGSPPDADKVFVYGREVKDFRTVDYDAISMLHLSATQQLKKDTDQEIKALRSECDELRSMNLALMKRLEALERRMSGDNHTRSIAPDTVGH